MVSQKKLKEIVVAHCVTNLVWVFMPWRLVIGLLDEFAWYELVLRSSWEKCVKIADRFLQGAPVWLC